MAILAPFPVFRAFNLEGTQPLAGGKLYSYVAGTSTPLATYTDSTGGTPNTNPVILDAAGMADIWLAVGVSYKFVLTDSADVVQRTTDNINISPGPFASLDPAAFTADLKMDEAQFDEAYGGDVASASTVDLSTLNGNSGRVTGSTTINGFGNVQAGAQFRLYFNGALQLTNSPSLLLNNGGGNILTAAGDRIDLLSLGSGNWIGNFVPVSGAALNIASTSLGLSMLNGTLTASVATNALTISLKTLAGNDPSSGDPVKFVFRNSNAATGNYVVRNVTSATSLVISSGSTLGAPANTPFTLQISASDDAGTVRLGALNITNGQNLYPFRSGELRSSLAEGGAGAADTVWQLYTNQAISGKALSILGYMRWSSGLVTPGAWVATPDVVVLAGPLVAIPGSRFMSFTSTDQTITAGGLLTIAHGFGVAPFPGDVSLELVNVTTEGNWAVGDVIAIGTGQTSSTASDSYGFQVYVDATNIYIRIGSTSNSFLILNKTTGAGLSITPAKWNLRVRARILE